jgi:hypothetical protein
MIDETSEEFRRTVGEIIEWIDTLGKEKAARRLAGWLLEYREERRRTQHPDDPKPLHRETYA